MAVVWREQTVSSKVFVRRYTKEDDVSEHLKRLKTPRDESRRRVDSCGYIGLTEDDLGGCEQATCTVQPPPSFILLATTQLTNAMFILATCRI
jgi:hypothetical protein